ncbi:MAG: hypothetical protein CVV29_12550 [Methanobacteriales archaeon HGW-Methanobacteriales-2]|jgi:hypothetical protein|nr:MAG: hypothetical protein CVV29_12550 [Methanobacteriales archaeon HGW-Methanobacteriales-2]
MTHAPTSDALKNLVRFMVCLAALGIILALVIQFSGIFPVEPTLAAAPLNTYPTPVNDQITDAVT